MATAAATWTPLALVRRLRSVSTLRAAGTVAIGWILSALLGLSGAFFLCVLLSLPIVAFFGRVTTLQSKYEISDREVAQLVVTSLGGAFPGAFVTLMFECLLAPLLALLCFADQSDSLTKQLRAFLDEDARGASGAGTAAPPHAGRIANMLQSLQIEKTFGYYVFVVLSAYVVAGLVEEATKLWVVQARCLCNCSKTSRRGWLCDPRRLLLKRTSHPNHHVVIVLAVTAAALGFASLENLGYTFAAPTFDDRLQTAVLRSVVSLPLHSLCGALTGIRLARALLVSTPETSQTPWRQKGWVLWPAVLVHGTFDFQIFLLSSVVSSEAAEAHPLLLDVVIPGGLSLAVLYGAYRLGQLQWRQLEAEVGGNGQYAHVGGDLEDEVDSDDDDDEAEGAKPVKRSAPLMV